MKPSPSHPPSSSSSLHGRVSQAVVPVGRFLREVANDRIWDQPEVAKLKTVPINFKSVEEYINVFEPLIFEECRAKLRAEWEESLELSSEKEHVEVGIKCVKKRRGGCYAISVESTDKCNLTFKDGDVAILSSLRPGADKLKRKNSNTNENNTEITIPKRVACTIWGQRSASRKVSAPMLYYFSNSEIAHIKDVDGDDINDNCVKEINSEGDINNGEDEDSCIIEISSTEGDSKDKCTEKVHTKGDGNNGEDHARCIFDVSSSSDESSSEDSKEDSEDDDYPDEDDQILRQFKINDIWYLTVIGSQVTTEREYNALHSFPSFDLKMQSTILNPKPDLFAQYEVEKLQAMDDCLTSDFIDYLHKSFSKPQLLSIQWAAMSKSGEQDLWPFTLIQGPPGTGKTHTVWGILNVFLELYQTKVRNRLAAEICEISYRNRSKEFFDGFGGTDERYFDALPQKPKILVCAPSNAATDELLARVLDRGFFNGEIKVYHPEVVRVGCGSQSQDAQAVSAERRTEQILIKDNDAVASLSGQLTSQESQLSEEIDSLKKELKQDPCNLTLLYKLGASLDEKRKVLLGKDRMAIVQRYSEKTITRVVARDLIEASFADEADIVFTTVSSTCCKLFSRMTRGFDMVVVDEAAQANEVGVLPPLVTGAARCVLVGDHHQLSATVISKDASKLSYGRSLFERFQLAGCPALLLSIQYRMHPEIRQFPSRYFYEGRLTDGESIKTLPDESYHSDPFLRPYLFFDISNGRESHRVDSVSYENIQEARFCRRLYERLQEKLKSMGLSKVSVGIITPYKLQMKCLKREFREVLNSKEGRDLYINTVDAFQGQERVVIIMSCVRTSDQGVGFVADARRMNVAITRAKRALWVVGHADALKKAEDWSHLICDAKLRRCFVELESLPEELMFRNQRAQDLPPRSVQEYSKQHAQEFPRQPRQDFSRHHAQEFPRRYTEEYPNLPTQQFCNPPPQPNWPPEEFPDEWHFQNGQWIYIPSGQQVQNQHRQRLSNRDNRPGQRLPNQPAQQFSNRPGLSHQRNWGRTEPENRWVRPEPNNQWDRTKRENRWIRTEGRTEPENEGDKMKPENEGDKMKPGNEWDRAVEQNLIINGEPETRLDRTEPGNEWDKAVEQNLIINGVPETWWD